MFKTTNCLQYGISRDCGAEGESYNWRPPWRPYREDDTLPLARDTLQETGRVSRKPEKSEHPSRQKSLFCVIWRQMGVFPVWSPGNQSRISLGSPLLICFCFSKPSLQAFKPFQTAKALTLKCVKWSIQTQTVDFDWAEKSGSTCPDWRAFCFNLTTAWTTAAFNEPQPD